MNDRTRGIITTTGRKFHYNTQCPGYRRGTMGDVKVAPVEHVYYRTAHARGKTICARCWRQNE